MEKSVPRGYRTVRSLHLYLGLFLSPFLLVFAVSTLVLNHRLIPSPEDSSTTIQLQLDDALEPPAQARAVVAQLGLVGELRGARRVPATGDLRFAVTRPGEAVRVKVTSGGEATLDIARRGLMGAMIDLHFNPGPHRPRGQTNWLYSKLWNLLTDATVYGVLFLTLSGVYLWTALRAERRIGMIMLLLGAGTFVSLVASLLLTASSPF